MHEYGIVDYFPYSKTRGNEGGLEKIFREILTIRHGETVTRLPLKRDDALW